MPDIFAIRCTPETYEAAEAAAAVVQEAGIPDYTPERALRAGLALFMLALAGKVTFEESDLIALMQTEGEA